jgi:hypothetical protein
MSKQRAFRAAALVTVFLAVLGIALPATAGDGVPFKGIAAAVIVGAVPVGDTVHLSVTGTGQATHLGRFTRVENLVLYADGTLDGTLTFKAANGDLLVADVAGGFASPPGILPATAAGTCTFTGGTGRFSDASGGYEWAGITFDSAHFSIVFEGDISF